MVRSYRILPIVFMLSAAAFGWLILSRRHAAPNDAWLTEFPRDWNVAGEAIVPHSDVRPGAHADAEKMLEHRPWVLLKDDEVRRLTTGEPHSQMPTYLVRAVAGDVGTAGLGIVADGDRLWVQGGALATDWVDTVRRPIVVQLPREPTKVYVTFSVAE